MMRCVLLLSFWLCGTAVSDAATTGTCDAGKGGSGHCPTAGPAGKRLTSEEFWALMRRQGLQVKLRRKTVEEKAQAGRSAHNRTAMVLVDDVFYGRPIMKVPRPVLLSAESGVLDAAFRRELATQLLEERTLAKRKLVTGEDALHLLSLAYPLIVENRDPSSVFRDWLDAVRDVRLPVLELTARQLRVLDGTTVEGAHQEMVANRDLIKNTASNFTPFGAQPVSQDEAAWALAVIMRHARVVHPHQDVREVRAPRMYLIPLKELLDVHLHPDPTTAISFQEEMVHEGKFEEELVLQIARRDMAKGEEVFLWPGRLSNSEMIVRHGLAFPVNHVGIGRNATEPPNWKEDGETNERREYERHNCSSLEAFELRLSPRGLPMANFVRCFRVSWFMINGWYTPAYRNKGRELSKWPPPERYKKEDWLTWTQADAELNRMLLDYCKAKRQQLKDTMDSAIANDFRNSSDPMDQLLWYLRSEESKTFKECIKKATQVKEA